jgi:hypothetical protein
MMAMFQGWCSRLTRRAIVVRTASCAVELLDPQRDGAAAACGSRPSCGKRKERVSHKLVARAQNARAHAPQASPVAS